MYKIVLCGDGAVGKTTLRLKYMGRGFQAKYIMTIGADFALLISLTVLIREWC